MKKIVIIGAGGHGRETAQLIKDINKQCPTWELIGYLDDNPSLSGHILNGYPVLGNVKLLTSEIFSDVYVICAIGSSKVRKQIIDQIEKEAPTVKFATLVHPTVVLGDEISIGKGSAICANTVVTTNISIGEHVIINYGCTVGHDSVIHDYATILPGTNISGNVTIHEGADIGTGTAIIPGVEIGAFTIVGAGAVVTKSLPEYCTAVGVPAKPIKFHDRKE